MKLIVLSFSVSTVFRQLTKDPLYVDFHFCWGKSLYYVAYKVYVGSDISWNASNHPSSFNVTFPILYGGICQFGIQEDSGQVITLEY